MDHETDDSPQRSVPERFVDAVETVLEPASGRGNRGSNAEIRRWRNAARRSDRLTAEIVTPALTAVARSGVCFARPVECIDVCVAVEQDCTPCLFDSDCRAVLRQVCGGLPGGICGLPSR